MHSHALCARRCNTCTLTSGPGEMQTSACTCRSSGFHVGFLDQHVHHTERIFRCNTDSCEQWHEFLLLCHVWLHARSTVQFHPGEYGRYFLPTTPRIVSFHLCGPRPLGLEPSWILGTRSCLFSGSGKVVFVVWDWSDIHHSVVSPHFILQNVPATCEPAGWKIGVHGHVVQDRNLHAARGREVLYFRLGFFHVLTFRTSQVPQVASEFHSSASGLPHTGSGHILKVGCTQRHQLRLEFAPPPRPWGRPGVFHRRSAPPHRPSPGHPFFHVFCCSLCSTGRTHAGSRLPSRLPFVFDCLVHASSASTSTRAVQWTLGGD